VERKREKCRGCFEGKEQDPRAGKKKRSYIFLFVGEIIKETCTYLEEKKGRATKMIRRCQPSLEEEKWHRNKDGRSSLFLNS